ncbi:glycoside hydrolase family 47 protein [Botryobasidium botryosum FD-172 SS1]|uniref:alpha-1,2-Mannosidase n=1 Tax=Botryobasidium botryosum (strain FD-172 SS1) TaxID=930990 RepID=A0A067MLT2_BOTB1|nr:glycoside hydrolase family 47 protein [Botryobasidium botryosum FD-172 SS1]
MFVRLLQVGFGLIAFAALLLSVLIQIKGAGFIERRIPSWKSAQATLPPNKPSKELPPAHEMKDAVVRAFQHAWSGYERDAFGDDQYHPIGKHGSNMSSKGAIGYTILDALDTMLLMGLTEEYSRSREWVATKLTFDIDQQYNMFETTIRVLGGLLSAYHLSGGDSLYLEKAVDLADRMMPAFDTPSGLPHAMFNAARRVAVPDTDNQNLISTAEAGTVQLEFKYLSHLTGNPLYWEKTEKAMEVIKNALGDGLAPISLSPITGQFIESPIRLGSRGDSFYEYLLKQYLQTARTENVYRKMYDGTMREIHDRLIRTTNHANFTYTVELLPDAEGQWRVSHKQDHLVCFLGGSLLLGATEGRASVPPNFETFMPHEIRDWNTGLELIKTCMMTHETATKLSPEIAYFYPPEDPMSMKRDWYIKKSYISTTPLLDARYILRPETVESLFLAYRMTGNQKYREWGWEIFQAIEKHCKVPSGGYAGVNDVAAKNPQHIDSMETFFLGETLKYLYLLFSDPSMLPLKGWSFVSVDLIMNCARPCLLSKQPPRRRV